MLILAMFVADMLWWLWAFVRLRSAPRARLWRALLCAFMAIQVGCLLWIILGRMISERTDELLPKFVVAAVFIWHFIMLPLAMLQAIAGTLGRSMVRPAMPGTGPTRREFLRAAAVAAPPVACMLAGGYSLRQLEDFRVRRFDVGIEQLPAALDGLRIAHVSDVHVGRFTSGKLLRKIADAVNEIDADLVLLTGDLINHALADLPMGLEMARRMRSRYGVFMCEGNHDLIESRAGFERAVKQSDVPLLVNETTMLSIRGQDVQLMGLRWGPGRGDAGIALSMKSLLSQRRAEAFAILLAHHPHAFDPAADAGIPLTLCGHTHGGQLMLGPNVGCGPMMFRYWSGLYRKNGSSLIVSNGVGNWFPLRINAPAEIGQITLHRA